MRIFMQVEIPNERGNQTIKDGTLPRLLQEFMEQRRPESAYFLTNSRGNRTAHFYVDVKDPSELPGLAEPMFMELNANITYTIAMNAEDLKKGMGQLKGMAAVGAR